VRHPGRPGSEASEGNRHVQVTQYVPDRARGILAVIIAIVALAWPGVTVLAMVVLFAAFASGEPAGTRVMFILGGLAIIAFGVVLCARPGLGAITLALLFALFNLIAGTWMLVQGAELRRTGKTLQPAHSPHQEKMAA
jgi:uncharacterized membrane protein HdeD (DUF308 family)